ncbi:MAG: septation protein SepH [Corynebacterium sp.]|nr:septation protein SepH [Corynebacterium sp.]
MRELFINLSDSTKTSLVLHSEDGEEFFIEVTPELVSTVSPQEDVSQEDVSTAHSEEVPQDNPVAPSVLAPVSTLPADSAKEAPPTEANSPAEKTPEEDKAPGQSQGSTPAAISEIKPAGLQAGPRPLVDAMSMRPAEIQARVRAGATAAELADEMGVAESRVEPFAYPVMLERARIAELAKQAHPIREDGPAKLTLWEVLATAFAARGHSLSDSSWTAYREQGTPWIIRVTWTAGLSENEAEWTLKQSMSSASTVEARNSVAADLTDPDFVQPVRTLTSIGRGARYDEAIAPGRGRMQATEHDEDYSKFAGPDNADSYDALDEEYNAGFPADFDAETAQEQNDDESTHHMHGVVSDLRQRSGRTNKSAGDAAQDAPAPAKASKPSDSPATNASDSEDEQDFFQNPDPEAKPTKRRRKAVTPHWEDVLLGVRANTKRPRK